jgi:hypothetical protein
MMMGMSSTMFFYGTLMDRDVLALVLGRAVSPAHVKRGTLDGWRRVPVAGKTYPMVVEHPGGRVDGVLVDHLSDGDIFRLAAYEGQDYATAMVDVRPAKGGARQRVAMFVCLPHVVAVDGPWSYARWKAAHKSRTLAFLRRQ